MAKKIIFDGYDDMKWYEEAVSFLMEKNGGCSENDLDRAEAEELEDEYKAKEAHGVNEKIKSFFEEKSVSGQVFVSGTLGRWNGVSSGCQLFDNFEEAFEFATDDCDLYKWSEEDGVLHLEASHHDGTNYVNFYLVNKDDFDDELEMLYAMVGINITERALNEDWISVPHFLSLLEENAE